MGWSTTSRDRPVLWAMEEAKLTADTDPHRIGWVQVGLAVGSIEPMESPTHPPESGYSALPIRRRSTDPALVLPPLVQCFHDSLSRFGAIELSSLQVTASRQESGNKSRLGHLVSVLNWFNTDLNAGAEAIASFDRALIGDHDVSELVRSLEWRNTGSFEFGSVASVPDQYMVKVSTGLHFHSATPPSDQGVVVTMPEWTASAAGWVLASVIDAASAIGRYETSFAVRLTRTR